MVGSIAPRLALASLFASGCAAPARSAATVEIGAAAPGSPEPVMVADSARPAPPGAHRWVGVWEDAETAGHVRVTVRLASGVPTVVSVIESRGDLETMGVRSSRWHEKGLEYRYYVPSTRYLVTMSCGSVTRDAMECSWSNDHQASGNATLTRVTASRPEE